MPNVGEIETGTMKINPDLSIKIAPSQKYEIPNGYHSGKGRVYVDTLQALTPGTATADDILVNKSGFVNGTKINGNLPNMGGSTAATAVTLANNVYSVHFNRGAYLTNSSDGYPVITFNQSEFNKSGDIVPSDIKYGTVIAGQTGTFTGDGNAVASDVVAGYFGYVKASKITGNLKTQNCSSISASAINNTQITVTWTNPSVGPYQGVRIYRNTSNSLPSSPAYTGVGSNSAKGGRSSVTLSGLSGDTTYYIWIIPYCGSLPVGSTLSTSARTKPNVNTASGSVTTSSYRYVRVTWNKPSTNFTGVRIVMKQGGWPANINDGTVVTDNTGTSYTSGNIGYATWYVRVWSYYETGGTRLYGGYFQGSVTTTRPPCSCNSDCGDCGSNCGCYNDCYSCYSCMDCGWSCCDYGPCGYN